ncbi:hypothetical protein B484DRAFT_421224, partial [Ochromonadaceae sp. CCMP2298]
GLLAIGTQEGKILPSPKFPFSFPWDWGVGALHWAGSVSARGAHSKETETRKCAAVYRFHRSSPQPSARAGYRIRGTGAHCSVQRRQHFYAQSGYYSGSGSGSGRSSGRSSRRSSRRSSGGSSGSSGGKRGCEGISIDSNSSISSSSSRDSSSSACYAEHESASPSIRCPNIGTGTGAVVLFADRPVCGIRRCCGVSAVTR